MTEQLLSYYLRYRSGDVVVESCPIGENASVLSGFIRWTPEITNPNISDELKASLKAEADEYIIKGVTIQSDPD